MNPDRTNPDRVRAYYRTLDEDDYTGLESLLTPAFVHERPDRTFEGRDRFVQFMREERPQTDTTHPISAIYRPHSTDDDGTEFVARGRLLDADGNCLVQFVDVFTFDDGRIDRIETYTQ